MSRTKPPEHFHIYIVIIKAKLFERPKIGHRGGITKYYLACPSKVLCMSKNHGRVDIVHRYKHELSDYNLDSGSILTTYTPT